MTTMQTDISTLLQAHKALIMLEEEPPVDDRSANMLTMMQSAAHREVLEVAKRMASNGIQNGAGFFHAYSRLVSSFSENVGDVGFLDQQKAEHLRPVAILTLTLFINSLTDERKIISRPASFFPELLALLFRQFEPHGFLPTIIPDVTEDYDIPPYLKELKKTNEKKVKDGEEILDFMPIDGLLGSYSAHNSRITLYMQGIRRCAVDLRCNEGFLRAVVLVHEIAHWIVHQLPHTSLPNFNIKSYTDTDTETHETLAQLLTRYNQKLCLGR